MQIAIISDSHYAVDKVTRLYSHLQEEGVTHLIHAGDFIGQGIEKVFKAFPSITSYVARGNCDTYGNVMEAVKKLSHVIVDDILYFELESIRFIVSHIPGTAFNVLNSREADVMIHGHTHQPRVETVQNTLILNPGSLMDGDGYMILELPSLKVDRRFTMG